MIILRNKLFTGWADGFGGKKSDIIRDRNLKKSDSYKNYGPWRVELCEVAQDQYEDPDSKFTEKDLNTIDAIIEEIKTKPFSGNYGQHPLWEFRDKTHECVVWSAVINEKDRLNYLIFKTQNFIQVTNLIGHTVIDKEYAVRPKI